MNLSSMDLNLLPVLHALIRERHVTRAGERLGLSQPATSAGLARLRLLFGNSLLERDGNQMRLTPRALELREPVANALAALAALFEDSEPFDARKAQGVFRIATTDYVMVLIIPALERFIENSGSPIQLEVHPITALQQRMDDDRLDLVIGTFDRLPGRFRRQALFEERYVCVVRTGHPVLQDADTNGVLPLDSYLNYTHLRVSPKNDELGSLMRVLSDIHRVRKVGCVVPEFMAAPAILRATDLIGTLPERLACQFAGQAGGLELLTLELELPSHIFEMVWHTQKDGSLLDRWIRGAIASIAESLDDQATPDPGKPKAKLAVV